MKHVTERRVSLTMPKSQVDAVDTWRAAVKGVPSRANAIRRLVDVALSLPAQDVDLDELAARICKKVTHGHNRTVDRLNSSEIARSSVSVAIKKNTIRKPPPDAGCAPADLEPKPAPKPLVGGCIA